MRLPRHTKACPNALHWTGSSRLGCFRWRRRWRLLPASELVRCNSRMRSAITCLLLALPLLNGCIVLPIPYTMRGSGTFHGRVLQADTKSPVQGAVVEVLGYPKTATSTTSDGEFTVGPGRKFYWYTVIGFHQHIVPEPVWPTLSTSIMVSHPAYAALTVEAGPKEPSREVVHEFFEVGNLLLKPPDVK